jgi:hypothetical protein
MAVKGNDLLTSEQLENNYEYKVVKKMIKKEYPWVIDVIPPSEKDLNEYNLIFLDLVIDPYILQEEKEWPIIYYIIYNLKHYGTYKGTYLSVIFDVSYRESQDVIEEMITLAQGVKKSPALPKDLKLPENRRFSIGSFIIPSPSELPIPDDVIVSDSISKR